MQCIYTDSVLFARKPNENNKLQPIAVVSFDNTLPKIDFGIEHVLR